MSLPYYQMYPRDFEASNDVLPLNSSERGLYLWCLNRSWMDDGLPESAAKISLILPASMLGSFVKDWPAIALLFPVVRGRRRRNKRQEIERRKADLKSKTNKNNVLTRYERRSKNSEVVALRASDSDDDSDSESGSDKSSSSSSEKVRSNKILRFKSDDDENAAAVEYATPQDELKALILEKTGSPLPGTDLAWITEELGRRGKPLAGFVVAVRMHQKNKWKNPIGMLKSLVRKHCADAVPLAAPETKAAMEDRTYRCPDCASTKRGEGVLMTKAGVTPCECASPEYVAKLKTRGILGAPVHEQA